MALGGRICVGAFIDWPESGPYHIGLLRGIDGAATEMGANLLVFATRGASNTDTLASNAGAMMADFLDCEVLDGVLAVAGQEMMAAREGRRVLPTVCVGKALRDLPVVLFDSHPGFDALLSHLFRVHGYREPAFVSGPLLIPDAADRLSSYRAALEREGLGFDEERVYYGNFLINDGDKAVAKFYDERGSRPDVIICANDGMAIGVRQALSRRGLRVPDDVALTGYDDMPFSPRHEGPLTTVRQSAGAAGREAMLMLRGLLEGRKPEPAIRRIGTELVIRASCGCRRSDPNAKVSLLEDIFQDEVFDRLVEQDRESFTNGALAYFSHDYIGDWRLNGHPRREADILGELNVGTMYVTSFEEGRSDPEGQSRLMIAWEGGKRLELPEAGVGFPTKAMLPEPYAPKGRFSVVVESLSDGESRFGLLLLQLGAAGNNVYEALRLRLSEAMKAVKIAMHLSDLNAELDKARLRLEELSLTDELTGLYNRRGFLTLASRQVTYCRRQGEGFWILYLDLDGLKKINDRWGHEDGDLAIRALASLAKNAFRATDIVARLGGDEFVTLVSNAPPEILGILEERMGKALEETNSVLAKPWRLSFSMGRCYSDPESSLSLDALMHNADLKLYEEKRKKGASPRSKGKAEGGAKLS